MEDRKPSASDMIKPIQPVHRKFAIPTIPLAALLAVILFSSAPAFAVSKDMVQLQTQIQELQDAVARLQQSNDERMGVMKDLIQQSADSINKMGANVDAMRKQLQTQQEAQGGKVDQVSGQIQSLNDSVDEIKARIATLQKLMQDVQSQQQSMSAGMPQPTGSAAPQPSNSAPITTAPPTGPAPIVRKGKPSANIPQAADAPGPAVPPADELYKTALGDYMAAKYPLASSEFGDVVKYYPDNPLSGNSFYYQAEIDFRDGRYPAAIKSYDAVLEQYPDSNKVPASHLHKGIALFNLKENEAGTRELRALIQRFPNAPESMQARSKLSGMGIPVTPKH
ncbi:tetratricopeptide repeat protein [Tunturiibacter gelidoferens]|uniref:TolA-binding protein n=1 Tax=Tunturiibacter gelidiferens TaxID=3069689 RepID=A0ACC5NVN5_9BACT|nr:tetratricopeptide repeat protein [Edaphobacter lichenicola]MBB5338580.1 TolA-binding protein [Edaphobacter lichenicola]